MNRRLTSEQDGTLHVVLDDATVERLRRAADRAGVELEQLIVHVIHQASWHLDDTLSGLGGQIAVSCTSRSRRPR